MEGHVRAWALESIGLACTWALVQSSHGTLAKILFCEPICSPVKWDNNNNNNKIPMVGI